MGLEARCHGRSGSESGDGRLQHEGDRLLFRGAFRLDIAVKDLRAASVTVDDLLLSWGKETASFTLGAAAATKWAHKILHPPSLLDKLGIKPGQRVAIKGKFDEAFVDELRTRVEPDVAKAAGKPYDVVLLLAGTPAELPPGLDTLPPLLTPAGALWVVYPKGGGAIKESQVREAGKSAGLVDNKTCSFSASLTALRWVRPRGSR